MRLPEVGWLQFRQTFEASLLTADGSGERTLPVAYVPLSNCKLGTNKGTLHSRHFARRSANPLRLRCRRDAPTARLLDSRRTERGLIRLPVESEPLSQRVVEAKTEHDGIGDAHAGGRARDAGMLFNFRALASEGTSRDGASRVLSAVGASRPGAVRAHAARGASARMLAELI
jgi:hypothetical protein